MIFVWAVLRNIPVAVADRIYGGAWTNLGKGLALTGGGLAVAGLPQRWFYVARVFLGAFLVSSGSSTSCSCRSWRRWCRPGFPARGSGLTSRASR